MKAYDALGNPMKNGDLVVAIGSPFYAVHFHYDDWLGRVGRIEIRGNEDHQTLVDFYPIDHDRMSLTSVWYGYDAVVVVGSLSKDYDVG